MADPTIYTSDNFEVRIRATLDGKRAEIASATISVWDKDDNKDVTDASMTVNARADEVSYEVATSIHDAAGDYDLEATVVLANSQGTISVRKTYTVSARHA